MSNKHIAGKDRPVKVAMVFIQCYARAALPSELPGIEWAVAGPVVDAAHYDAFGGASVS